MKLRFALIALMASASLAAMTVPEPKPDISKDAVFGTALQELDLAPQLCFTLSAVDHTDMQAPDVAPAEMPDHDNRFTALFAKADAAFSNSIYAPDLDRLCKRLEYELLCTGRLMVKVYDGNKYRLEPTPAAWLRPEKPRVLFHK